MTALRREVVCRPDRGVRGCRASSPAATSLINSNMHRRTGVGANDGVFGTSGGGTCGAGARRSDIGLDRLNKPQSILRHPNRPMTSQALLSHGQPPVSLPLSTHQSTHQYILVSPYPWHGPLRSPWVSTPVRVASSDHSCGRSMPMSCKRRRHDVCVGPPL